MAFPFVFFLLLFVSSCKLIRVCVAVFDLFMYFLCQKCGFLHFLFVTLHPIFKLNYF